MDADPLGDLPGGHAVRRQGDYLGVSVPLRPPLCIPVGPDHMRLDASSIDANGDAGRSCRGVSGHANGLVSGHNVRDRAQFVACPLALLLTRKGRSLGIGCDPEF